MKLFVSLSDAKLSPSDAKLSPSDAKLSPSDAKFESPSDARFGKFCITNNHMITIK